MQRQSLGSSAGMLHGYGGGAKEEILPAEDPNRLKDSSVSSSSISESYEDDDHKTSKRHRFSSPLSSSPTPEKYIHIIPILTVFCFLVLYICSHTPSQSDLSQFGGFKDSLKHKDSWKIGEDMNRVTGLEKGKLFSIQSLRNLQGINSASGIPTSGSHRKMAGF